MPTVLSAEEILDKAFLRASKVNVPAKDAFDRARGSEIARLRSAENTIEATLEKYVTKFPSFDQLPPFYRDLAAILLDLDRTRKALGAVDWARKRVVEIGDESAAKMKRARSADAIREERKRAYGRISSVVEQVAKDLAHLTTVREVLRGLPDVDPDVATIVVAGYPNVGKSSFVRRVSRAEPEVAPYPFTTKGVVIGHFERRRVRYQVIDTPGLLDRPLEERNSIERQAVLALQHLADVVVFLVDPTGHCGYPVDAQERLLEEVRRTFPGVPIVVGENKSDVASTPPAPERLRLSTLSGDGVEAILEAAVRSAEHFPSG